MRSFFATRLKGAFGLIALALVAVAVSACGSSNGSSGSPSSVTSGSSGGSAGSSHPSSAGSSSKQIDAFLPPTSDPYAANWLKGLTAEGQTLGYSIHPIETPDPAAAASQVQQIVNGGNLPAAVVWWPIDAKAELGTLAQLARTKVPIFAANQLPVPGSAPYLVAFSGVSDLVVGREDGMAAIQACSVLKRVGQVHGTCNVIGVLLPPGYGATTDRLRAFKQAIAGSSLKIIATANTAGFTAQDAFTTTAQLISANRAKGINIVYTEEDDYAIGAIQALSQGGYQPGKTVEVIGGSCHGNDSQLLNGKQFSTVIQGAGLEGHFTIETVAQYLKTRKVQAGNYLAPATPDAEPPIPTTISKMNLVPLPFVTAAQYQKGIKLWGQTAKSWCTY